MKCPKCQADNPDTSRFCGNCATSLSSAGTIAPSLTETLDSQRLLMVKLEARKPTPVTEMILVQNWFEELERLVPVRKR